MKKMDMKIEAAEPKKDKEDIADYEIEDAVRTLLRAEEHKMNPKMMDKVHAKLGQQKKAINSIKGLKKRRQELQEEED